MRRATSKQRYPATERNRPAEPTFDLLYGRNAVRESLRARRRRGERLLLAEGLKPDERITELLKLAENENIEVAYGPRHALDDMTSGANHQGVALETGLYPYTELDAMLQLAATRGERPLLLLLDHLQDPQNLGTLLRTADAISVHGIIFPDRRAVAITPAVVNASSGAVEHLLVSQVTNLVKTMETLKEQNIWVVGLEDDSAARDYDAVDLAMPLALVVGAEGPGLSRLVRERCDVLIKLPMSGHVASLNAATAGSIALYHLWRIRAR
ncbi:MAG: 23S rRNA (guanosine(2251)-2'-O)-methyltransferase RlmB [Herpetosiphon sp.]